MRRELLRPCDFIPAHTNRRERGQVIKSKDLAPANLTDTQEATLLRLFLELKRKRGASV